MTTRRHFVHQTLKAAPLLLLSSALFQSCRKEYKPNGKKVVVIGAGISGLSAAEKLKYYGFEVVVLEAQDKIGGRICTSMYSNVVFDEGASWIHGSKGNPITKIAKSAGANTKTTNDESVSIFKINGEEYAQSFIEQQEAEFEKALNNISKNGQIGQSFEDVFNSMYPGKTNDLFWRYMLSAYLEFNTAGDISRLSSLYFYDDEEFGGSEELIINGYDKITKHLAKDLDILLNEKVEEVIWDNSRVEIKTSLGIHNADFVVVSIPLGVLKVNSVKFVPELPESKLNSVTNLEMGVVNKFLLIWNSPFWNKNLHYIGVSPNEKGKFNYFLNLHHFSNNNALVTFAYGKFAELTETMTESECIEEIMQNLKIIHGNNIPYPSSFYRTRWGQNPHILGSYSYVSKMGKSSDFDVLATQVQNKLFFAGEHTSRDYRGTVHGAYLSGIREADKIFNLI